MPLFAVLLADWLAAGRSYQRADVFDGPARWVDRVERLDPPGWAIGATLPSFAVSFGVGLLATTGARRRSGTIASA